MGICQKNLIAAFSLEVEDESSEIIYSVAYVCDAAWLN